MDRKIEAKYEWFNTHIDRLQQDRSLAQAVPEQPFVPGAFDIEMLEMAATFRASRPGAGSPDASFVKSLRSRVLSAVGETDNGSKRRPSQL